jgi:hypothetical protein
LTVPEKGTKNGTKKMQRIPSVIKSIGVGGSSIFSAEITRKPEPEVAPHEEYLKEQGLSLDSKDKIPDD